MVDVRQSVPLAELTTFKIGGSAEYLCDVSNESEIREALAWAKERRVRYTVLAGGSNVVVPDSGIKGLVLHGIEGKHAFDDAVLAADFGCNLLSLIREAGSRGLGGWEKLAGIPGSIGGAVRGNAGAFGPEIKDFVTNVRALNAETDEVREFTNADCTFAYRQSFFKQNPQWIIVRVTLQLNQVQFRESEQLVEDTIAEREKRHLQNVQAAGSFFTNPVASLALVEEFEREKGVKSRENRVPAGWLIEKAGLKGATVGGAIASLQHPNYIVNTGTATAHDVLNLAQRIKLEVAEKFGIDLVEEAAILQ